jgi:predicted amidohydrolase YtcJ
VARTNLIMGFGYDNSQLAELRHPTRADLDAVSTDIPIFLIHQSSTSGRDELEGARDRLASRRPENPPGGLILKDAERRADGRARGERVLRALPGQVPRVRRSRRA